VRRRRERAEIANLRPDVAVEAQQSKPRLAQHLFDRAQGIAIQQVEAELAVALPRANQQVRVGVHFGRDAQHDGNLARRKA